MAEFMFEEKVLQILIAGLEFSLPICDKTAEKIRKMGKEMENAAKEGILSEKTIETLAKKYLNAILEKGAYERIFSGKKTDYLDKLDVLIFVAEEYRKHQDSRLSAFMKRANGA